MQFWMIYNQHAREFVPLNGYDVLFSDEKWAREVYTKLLGVFPHCHFQLIKAELVEERR